MRVKGEILVQGSRADFAGSVFDTERLNGRHREEFAPMSFHVYGQSCEAVKFDHGQLCRLGQSSTSNILKALQDGYLVMFIIEFRWH